MSPFKEPQPRKSSIQEQHEAQQARAWPPYAREGGEANWAEKPISEAPSPNAQWTMSEVEFYQSLETAREEAVTGLEYRRAALEAAIAWNNGECTAPAVVKVADVFEDYLKNGKPS